MVNLFGMQWVNEKLNKTMRINKSSSKITFVCHVDWFLVSHRLNLIDEALKRGYEVSVISSGTKYCDFFYKRNVKYFNINLSRNKISLSEVYNATKSIYTILKVINPEIVHNITAKSILTSSLACLFLPNIKLVVNAFSGLGYLFSTNTLKNVFQRNILLSLYYFIFNSSKKYKGIFQNNDDRFFFINKNIFKNNNTILIKGAGINIELYKNNKNCESDIVNILFPARLLKDKGISEFLGAAKVLITKYENIQFTIAGDIDTENPACIQKTYLDENLVSDKIVWIGYQTDMIGVFQQSDIVCLPSYREGLPKALLEASAFSLPIVTCDVEGCREIVKNGFNGFLVPQKTVLPLIDKLGVLIEDKQLRLTMGKNGRKLIEEEMTDTIVVNQTFNFYKRIT
jgi:glycosyltransferase involved in cell wall biosynthesis